MMFDLDNTLGNRTAAVQAWIREFCNDHALPPSAAEWILDVDNDGYSSRVEVFAAIRERFSLRQPAEDLVAAYQQRVVALSAPTVGALGCLVAVRSAGHSLAIVTNGSTQQQNGKIDAIGFRPMVDAVIVSGDHNIKKPDRRIFEMAVEATGESFDGAWMIGDSARHDIAGAQAVGANTAWLRRDRDWPADLPPPTVILDDLTQLMPALDAHR